MIFSSKCTFFPAKNCFWPALSVEHPPEYIRFSQDSRATLASSPFLIGAKPTV